MEIKEAKEKLAELDTFIEKKIREFEALTGLNIDYIELYRTEELGRPFDLRGVMSKCSIN